MTDWPSKILAHALESLETHGWTQETLWDNNGCMCSMGAIANAVSLLRGEISAEDLDGVSLVSKARDRLADQIVMAGHDSGVGWSLPVVTHWNDHPSRTFEEVREMFQAAIGASDD